MAYCGKCGTKLSNSAKYCPVCGNAVGSQTQKKVSKATPKRKSNAQHKDESLSIREIIAVGAACVTAFIGLCGGAIEACDGVWIVLIVSILASAALFGIFIGAVEKKYVLATSIGCIIAIVLAIGVSPTGNDEVAKAAREEHFSDMLPDDGSTTFIVEDCKPIGSDGLVIKSIEFFEKNGTRDFRLDGYLKNGKNVVLEGKWSDDEKEATYQGKEYEYYTFWCTDWDNYNFYVDSFDYLYCSFVFWDNDKDIGKAFQAGAVGKMKRANKEDVDKAAKSAKKEAEKQMAKYVGNYYYSFFIGNTNASLYFTISLKSDGTFTHAPSNETTKNYTEVEIAVDGKDYPSGGTWSASDDGISLSFKGSWSGGKISADMKRLEIYNMNGYNLKAPISKGN